MIRGIVREVIDYLRDPVAVPKETASLIGDELQFHLEESIREGIENGLSEAEAASKRSSALAMSMLRFAIVPTVPPKATFDATEPTYC